MAENVRLGWGGPLRGGWWVWWVRWCVYSDNKYLLGEYTYIISVSDFSFKSEKKQRIIMVTKSHFQPRKYPKIGLYGLE